jgi:hypothetical protein
MVYFLLRHKKALRIRYIGLLNGGETGIRTLEGFDPLPVFKTGAFNRSAISPVLSDYIESNH